MGWFIAPGSAVSLSVGAPGERLLPFEFFPAGSLFIHHVGQHFGCDADEFGIGFTDASAHLFDFEFTAGCLVECFHIVL